MVRKNPLRLACLGPALLAEALWAQGVTDPTRVLREPVAPRPAYLATYQDQYFGSNITRITDKDSTGVADPVHQYSQLPAWNPDQTLMLLNSGTILDARTFKPVHKVDFGWPAEGSALRWSPTEPLSLYYAGSLSSGQKDPDNHPCPAGQARLMRYRLVKGGAAYAARRELVRCFEEYVQILKDPSHEALSDDGKLIALVARKADGTHEAFAYDIPGNVKHAPLVLPIQNGIQRVPDWAGMSPSGKYVVVLWGKGMERFRGVEAYDARTMAFAGKISASSGHGDLTMDEKGVEYYVYSNANNAYYLSGSHYLLKSRIPVGVVLDAQGGPDQEATLATGASVPLMILDWNLGLHVSCRNIHSASKWCVVSTTGGADAAWVPFQREAFKVFLNSTVPAVKVERLAHTFSDVQYVADLPIEQCPVSNYWTQPHASSSPDGSRIVFGSSWGKHCRADAYQIDLARQPTAAFGLEAAPGAGRMRMAAIRGVGGLRISFKVPSTTSGSSSRVELDLADTRGAALRPLFRGRLEAGEHAIDLDMRDGRLAPGVYWCVLRVAGQGSGPAQSLRFVLPAAP